MIHLLLALAHAEPPVGEGGERGPLALPAGQPPPAVVRPGRRTSGPALDQAYSAAISRYRDERIRVRPYDAVTYNNLGYVGYGGWGPGFGWGLGFPAVWVDTDHRLAVYQGEERLSVPQTLTALQQPERAQGIERKIRKNRTWSNIGTGVGLLGLAGSIVGLVGAQTSPYPIDRELYNLGAIGSSAVMAGGFVFAGFPGSRAERLQYDPRSVFEDGELEREADRRNEELATELGLSPEDVVRIGDD